MLFEKKKKLRQAIEAGKPIPTELRDEEAELRHQIELEDSKTELPWNPIDDEYQRAGESDPRVMCTTSRDPSSRLVQFVKEMCLIFPNSQRINRGNYTTKELVDACRKNEVTDLVLVHEHRGEPDGLVVCHLPHGPTAFFGLTNVVTRHDIKTKEKVRAHRGRRHPPQRVVQQDGAWACEPRGRLRGGGGSGGGAACTTTAAAAPAHAPP